MKEALMDRTCLVYLLVLFCATACGCGEHSKRAGQRVPVSGLVLIDGAPLTTGTIRFTPTSGRPVSSPVRKDGTFSLREHSVSHDESGLHVLPGTYQVSVSAAEVVNAEQEEVRWLVPAHYADFRSSGLEVEIADATDDLQIELTWEGAQLDGNGDEIVDDQVGDQVGGNDAVAGVEGDETDSDTDSDTDTTSDDADVDDDVNKGAAEADAVD